MEDPVVTALSDEDMGELCKALGNPVRVQMLRILAQRGPTICRDMVDALPLAQSTVSQHLKVLREADLIHGEVDGPRRLYSLNPDRLAQFKGLVATL